MVLKTLFVDVFANKFIKALCSQDFQFHKYMYK